MSDAILSSGLSWLASKRSREVSFVKKRTHDNLPSENWIGLTTKFLQGVGCNGDLTQLDGVSAFDKNQFIVVEDIPFAADDGQRALLDRIRARFLTGNAFHVSLESIASCQGTEGHREGKAHFGIAVGLSAVTGLHSDGAAHDGDLRLAFHASVGVKVVRHKSPGTDP